MRRLRQHVVALGLLARDGALQPLSDRASAALGIGCFRIGATLLAGSVLLNAGLNLLGDPLDNAGRHADAIPWLATYWIAGTCLAVRLLRHERRTSRSSGIVVVDHAMRSDAATFAFVLAILVGSSYVGLDMAHAVGRFTSVWRPTLWNVLDSLSGMVVPYVGCLFGGCEWRRYPPVRRTAPVPARA